MRTTTPGKLGSLLSCIGWLACSRGEAPPVDAVRPAAPSEPAVVATASGGPVAPAAPPPAAEPAAEPPRRVAAARPASGKPAGLPTPAEREQFWAAIKAGRAATARKDHAAALAGFDAALAVIPEHPRALSGRGYAALLAGDLAAARRDLEHAIEVGPPTNIRGAIHFNLGLVAEKSGDAVAAQRHFAESNRIRPSKAAAAKLAAATPVCRAAIGREDTHAPRRAASWQALATELLGEGARAESAARAALCAAPDDPDTDRCAGQPPWHLTVQDADDNTLEAIVTRAESGLIFREVDTWNFASRCGTAVDVELRAGDPLVVHEFTAINTPIDIKVGEDGEIGDCGEDEECDQACGDAVEVYEEYLALDRATLQLRVHVAIRGEATQGADGEVIGGPKLTVRRAAHGLRVQGEGCDELTPFVAPAAGPAAIDVAGQH